MDLVSSQTRYTSRQKTDRAGSGHEHGIRFPEGALPDREDLLQGLYDHRRRLEQHAEDSQGRLHLDCVLGFDAPALRHKSVDFFDPPFGVPAVAAHVGFTHRTIGAGNRVRTPDNPGHQISLFE